MDSSGLITVKKMTVPISDLRFQYISLIYNREFWHGDGSLSVANSPHVRFLRSYQENPNLDIWHTDYVKLMLYWNSIGFHNRDRPFIESKVHRLTTLFKSVQKNGFDKTSRINILEEPFWKTRYRKEVPNFSGYEIWHGHHRAACCYVLGITDVPALLMKDGRKGSKKCERIDKRLKELK